MEIPTCSSCHRERTLQDINDYTPLQVLAGAPLGWYSGDDGEICPECMTGLMGRTNPKYASVPAPSLGDVLLAEQGRRLASEREDLIAAGADPAELVVPLHPDNAAAEVTPAVRRAAQTLLMTEHGEHADMYRPDTAAARAVLTAALAGEEIARLLCEYTGPSAYHGPVPCDEHSLAVAVVRDVILGGDQAVRVRRDEIIGGSS